MDHPVQCIFRIDLHERTLGAETEAADDVHGNFVLQVMGSDQLLKTGLDIHRIGGQAAGAAAQQDGTFAIGAVDFTVQRLLAVANFRIQFSKCFHYSAPPFARYWSMIAGTFVTETLG